MTEFLGIQLYSKTLWFKRGCRVDFKLTYRCNQMCPYCIIDIPAGRRAESSESTFEEWVKFFEDFPTKIREVMVCGGETTLIDWMPEFVNWLLDRGYHVTVYSNLRVVKPFMRIRRTYRLQLSTTYHHAVSAERFDLTYKLLRQMGFRVNVDEIDDGTEGWTRVLPYSSVKKMICTPAEVQEMDKAVRQFVVAPDRTIYFGCFDEFKDKGRRK